MRPTVVYCSALLLLLLLLVGEVTTASRSGGSSRSSSRSSSSSRSRSSGGRYYSSRGGGSSSTFSGLVSSGFGYSVKYRAVRSGYFYSSRTWRDSHTDFGSDSSSSLCFNFLDSPPVDANSSIVPWIYQNRTVYGIFVCPTDSQSYRTYCCGDDGAEQCCGFWENGGRVAGVVIAACIGLAILLGVISCVGISLVKKTPSAPGSVSPVLPIELDAKHVDDPPAYPGYPDPPRYSE